VDGREVARVHRLTVGWVVTTAAGKTVACGTPQEVAREVTKAATRKEPKKAKPDMVEEPASVDPRGHAEVGDPGLQPEPVTVRVYAGDGDVG